MLEIFYPTLYYWPTMNEKKPVDGGNAKLETFEKVGRSAHSFQLNAVVAEVILNSTSPTHQRTLGAI